MGTRHHVRPWRPGWRTGRILAAETGAGAAEEATIADIAASPNGLTLASAVVVPGADRVDVVIRDLIATGAGNVIASFNGQFDSISMSWLNNATIALALRAHPEPVEPGVNERSRSGRIRIRRTRSRRRLARTDCN